jgi:acyl dehydratase
MFPSATPTGEEVEFRLEVTEVQSTEGLADLTTLIIRPDGNRGLQGHTRVCLPHSTEPFGGVSPNPRSRVSESRPLKGIEPGQRAQACRTFTSTDLVEYADLTGDTNPLFTDVKYCQRHGLDGALVPGGLLGGLFSYLLGTELPGRGTNYLKQRLHFRAPAYMGRALIASVEVSRIRREKQLVNLSTICTEPTGAVVCHGEALVLVSDVEPGL